MGISKAFCFFFGNSFQENLGGLDTIDTTFWGATPELFQVMILVDVAPNQSEAGRLEMDVMKFPFFLGNGGFVVSHEKRAPGWLGYIGDYTTQLYRDYNKPL